jgi:ATP/maltotriose-dependent transcriptional regulator MalT
VEEALARCAEATDWVVGDRHAEAVILCLAGHLEAMRGDFDAARDMLQRARRRLDELGLRVEAAAMALEWSRVEFLAGDLAAAERELRRADAVLAEIGEYFVRSTLAGLLAHTLWAQSRFTEAEEMTILAEELSDLDDIDAQVTWRCARARVFASQGRLDQAEELALSAIELIEPTDAVVMQISAYADAGSVLTMRGRPEGTEVLERAVELARAKGGEIVLAHVLDVVAQAAHA